jgi:hypothetical protein
MFHASKVSLNVDEILSGVPTVWFDYQTQIVNVAYGLSTT